jgi:tRNA U34 5-carboxymethylaminomethyl modifying enzyme MnmG/GidA
MKKQHRKGFIAGINAHQKINDKHELILKRSESYIGVLIDDLVTKGHRRTLPHVYLKSRTQLIAYARITQISG